jgi:hypothetical protein
MPIFQKTKPNKNDRLPIYLTQKYHHKNKVILACLPTEYLGHLQAVIRPYTCIAAVEPDLATEALEDSQIGTEQGNGEPREVDTTFTPIAKQQAQNGHLVLTGQLQGIGEVKPFQHFAFT